MTSNPAKKTVLVVEDEPLLLMLAADIVEDAGFDVVTATNADAAIKVLLSSPDIHIVFTDIDMPGSMDGLKLAAAIRDRWPPIEIIVTSGKAWPAKSELPSRGQFFAKPYDAAASPRCSTASPPEAQAVSSSLSMIASRSCAGSPLGSARPARRYQ